MRNFFSFSLLNLFYFLTLEEMVPNQGSTYSEASNNCVVKKGVLKCAKQTCVHFYFRQSLSSRFYQVKRQTLLGINVHAHLFGTLE